MARGAGSTAVGAQGREGGVARGAAAGGQGEQRGMVSSGEVWVAVERLAS